MRTFIDLSNKRFGRLIVIKQCGVDSMGSRLWECLCDCGRTKTITTKRLNSHNVRSCGCMSRELASSRLKQYNFYDISSSAVKGITKSGSEFYFDLEDYDKIKDFCWYVDSDGYVKASDIKGFSGGKSIRLHNLIMGKTNDDVDHIDKNKLNNRKSNLRNVSHQNNVRNRQTPFTNKSGVMGVCYIKRSGKWQSYIMKKTLGTFFNFEDAVFARLMAEKNIYGEFAPQKDLFKRYNIS